jgi:hypothetical protein
MKCRWNRTMLNLCCIVVAILKMASPFSKWPSQYRTNSAMSDFSDISYVDRLWCPEFISDIEKFLVVAIFKMATTIQHKLSGINSGHHYLPTYQILMISDNVEFLRPFWKWRSLENFYFYRLHFQNGHHNTAKIQHCSISKVAFDLFFKPVVSGRFGRLETS